jgi:hypothetical protein
VLIALVLVNFDAEMTREWLLATLLTVCTTWLTDPLLAMLTVYFVALVGRLSCRKGARVVQNRFKRVHTASKLFGVTAPTPGAGTLTETVTETTTITRSRTTHTSTGHWPSSQPLDLHGGAPILATLAKGESVIECQYSYKRAQ